MASKNTHTFVTEDPDLNTQLHKTPSPLSTNNSNNTNRRDNSSEPKLSSHRPQFNQPEHNLSSGREYWEQTGNSHNKVRLHITVIIDQMAYVEDSLA